jgi:hypothetical protein
VLALLGMQRRRGRARAARQAIALAPLVAVPRAGAAVVLALLGMQRQGELWIKLRHA